MLNVIRNSLGFFIIVCLLHFNPQVRIDNRETSLSLVYELIEMLQTDISGHSRRQEHKVKMITAGDDQVDTNPEAPSTPAAVPATKAPRQESTEQQIERLASMAIQPEPYFKDN